MGREMTMQALQRQHFTSHPEPTQDGEEAIRSSRKASKPELGQDGHMPASATQRTLRGTHTGVRAMPMSSLDEDQFTSGDRRGPADSARKSAATKPRSRAHVWANRFPMRSKMSARRVLLWCAAMAAVLAPCVSACRVSKVYKITNEKRQSTCTQKLLCGSCKSTWGNSLNRAWRQHKHYKGGSITGQYPEPNYRRIDYKDHGLVKGTCQYD